MRAFARYVLFALVAAIATVVVSEPDLAKSQLTILKCCRFGESLQRPDDDANDDALPRCKPTSEKWQPLLFSVKLQQLVAEFPDDWHIVDGRWPDCDDDSELIQLPYRETNPFVLLDNGNAMLELSNTKFFPASHYCADSNALLLCMPKQSKSNQAAATMKPQLRRCCGDNAIFHEHG